MALNKEKVIKRLQEAESYVVLTISKGIVFTDIDLIDVSDKREFINILSEEVAKLKRIK